MTVVCRGISGVVVTTAIIMHISYFSYLTATLHSIDKNPEFADEYETSAMQGDRATVLVLDQMN